MSASPADWPTTVLKRLALPGGDKQAFTYDAWDRLTGASGMGYGGYTAAYTYDPIGNLTQRVQNGVNFTYTYSYTQPHAVRLMGTNTYTYDPNGSLTQRPYNGQVQTFTYTLENRVEHITVNGQTTVYDYDGDGVLVRRSGPESVVIYIAGLYEKNLTTSTVTQYYTLGGQRLALRVDGALTYLHPALRSGQAPTTSMRSMAGSASLATDASGALVSAQRYLPYGEVRWNSGALPTDRQFTGQRREASLGLVDYGARMYDPYLNRWLQPDTIIPDPTNPQNLNRYSYVRNNPLRYTDPSGHCASDDPVCNTLADTVEKQFGVTVLNRFAEQWTIETLQWLYESLGRMQMMIGEAAFSQYLFGVQFSVDRYARNESEWTDDGTVHLAVSVFDKPQWYLDDSGNYIETESARHYFVKTVFHELTHGILRGVGGYQYWQSFAAQTGWTQQANGEWLNPGTGPTGYVRIDAENPEEDLVDTFTCFGVPGTAEYALTPSRFRWGLKMIMDLRQGGQQ